MKILISTKYIVLCIKIVGLPSNETVVDIDRSVHYNVFNIETHGKYTEWHEKDSGFHIADNVKRNRLEC